MMTRTFPLEGDDHESDLTNIISGKSVPSIDTVALFSAKARSNGFRARYKHTGQTSSIYLSDNVWRDKVIKVGQDKAKYQIGTLAHSVALKGKGCIFTSIPNSKEEQITPLLDWLPNNTPIFGDNGFPYLVRTHKNFREVNHSKKAEDTRRNKFSKDRWSYKGINNQVSESMNRVLKYSFVISYSYVSPRYSQLYLQEFSALKSIRTYGLERVICNVSNVSIEKGY